jgi:hypothetical protein
MSTQHYKQILSGRQLTALHLIVAGVIFLLCFPASFASDSAKATIVYPTGTFPTDGINVQAAADKGGTVVLKATNRQGKPTGFNFGTPDPNHGGTSCSVAGVTVSLNIDVAILGERVGQKMTTINGGCTPILGLVPVKSKIEGIDFEAPVGGAIILIASTGTEIVGNRINGVIGALVGVASGFEFTDGDAIDLFGNDDPQNAVTGHAIIADNVIENLGAEFAIGMQLDEVSAEVDITGNTVRFPQSNGDVQTGGIAAFRSHSRVSIVGNDVSMGPGSLDSYPAPIAFGGDNDARYIVAFNSVAIDHPNGDGIIVTDGVDDGDSSPTQGAQIFGNRVSINSSIAGQSGASYYGGAGVDVYGAVNNSLIAANVIRGTSAFGLDVAEGSVSTATSDSDQLLLNDISGHTSLITDVYFGANTSNLLFVGHCATDIDQGVDNKISCTGARHLPSLERNVAAKGYANDSLRKSVQHEFINMIRRRSAQ